MTVKVSCLVLKGSYFRDMKKHIKVKASLVLPNFEGVKVEIIEQTHRGAAFGNNFSARFHYKRITIHSIYNPEFFDHGDGCAHLVVRGNWDSLDYKVVDIPIKWWPEVKEAIEAYNLAGEKGEI